MEPNSPSSPLKRPFALLEHSVIQFNDVLIPHRLDMLKKHKININKCLQSNDYKGASKEQAVASILIQNLSRDLIDIETLRNQVQDSERYHFDRAIASSKEKALQAIREFVGKNSEHCHGQHSHNQAEDTEDDSGYIPDSASIFKDVPHFLLEKHEGTLLNPDEEAYIQACEKLEADIEDLNTTFVHLNHIVQEQHELIGNIETNVSVTHDHVSAGHNELQKAVKYKAAMYPVVGAAIGTVIGGPIGLLVGLKTGAGLAVGGSFLGYIGGKLLKKKIQVHDRRQEDDKKSS